MYSRMDGQSQVHFVIKSTNNVANSKNNFSYFKTKHLDCTRNDYSTRAPWSVAFDRSVSSICTLTIVSCAVLPASICAAVNDY